MIFPNAMAYHFVYLSEVWWLSIHRNFITSPCVLYNGLLFIIVLFLLLWRNGLWNSFSLEFYAHVSNCTQSIGAKRWNIIIIIIMNAHTLFQQQRRIIQQKNALYAHLVNHIRYKQITKLLISWYYCNLFARYHFIPFESHSTA